MSSNRRKTNKCYALIELTTISKKLYLIITKKESSQQKGLRWILRGNHQAQPVSQGQWAALCWPSSWTRGLAEVAGAQRAQPPWAQRRPWGPPRVLPLVLRLAPVRARRSAQAPLRAPVVPQPGQDAPRAPSCWP